MDRTQLDAETNAQLTDSMIQEQSVVLKRFGKPMRFQFVRKGPLGGAVGYSFWIYFRSARILELIAFDPDGKIAGIDFQTYGPTHGVEST